MNKNLTAILSFFCLLAFGFIPFPAMAQGDPPVECNYTDGNCISIGYVNIEFVAGTPDKYLISVDYNIMQGGENNCPAISSIRFEPSFGNTGDIEIGDEEEIFGSAVIEVNASSFEAQGRILTMTVDYEDGSQKERIDLELPVDAECGDITPLPVELAYFEGKMTQSGVRLEWETASETNNSHFEVERSADGMSFAQLASIAGHGSSSVALSYSYLDRHPAPGLNYYRLKQVDFDGGHAYSSVVAVTAAEGAAALQVQLLPNPCPNGDCQLRITAAAPGQQVRLQLQDLTGRVVFEQSIKEDDQQLQLTRLQLKNLRGVFILSAEAGQEVVRQRIVLE